ncbi:HTH-type transcriptional regulator PuuR [Parendozoicomonas haliclonae]|nr:HTH-type transcriptional regulator PuuR [Parendozoicomonas haliclonae]
MNKVNVGDKVSRLRKAHNLTQRDLAERAGITHSAVSSIENNKVSPSISSLHKIVNVFSLSLSEFFCEEEVFTEPGVVITPDRLIEIGNDKVSMKLVCDGRSNRQLGFLIEEYQPGAGTGVKTIEHEGEEAGIVLEGELELTVGDKTYHIKAGESFLYDTSIAHSFRNPGKTVCKIISAHAPASF